MSTTSSVQAKYTAVPYRLSEQRGVVVRQKIQMREALAQSHGLPYEAANKYSISVLPLNKVVKNHPHDPDGWEPTDAELERLNTLHFTVTGARDNVYLINRPFRLGGLCCSPHKMNVSDASGVHGPHCHPLGRVREDLSPLLSRCFAACCVATSYSDIERALPEGSYEKRYTLRTNRAWCGRVNNCCKRDAVYDVLATDGQVVAHLQRTYGHGKDCIDKCFSMNSSYNDYVLEFPPDSTPEDRVLLLSALFHIEYQFFEGKS